ncbi:hypothetical protein E2C01_049722 [Portunus trituberculatus]|uniref:Uncharacterized protein n=1 Tax=Portunus trituberculatus TaxID=210409 RepID=A0A5B7GDV8_PORTR|nr:hypothetical protein [Portunus trituberculatus]
MFSDHGSESGCLAVQAAVPGGGSSFLITHPIFTPPEMCHLRPFIHYCAARREERRTPGAEREAVVHV